MYHVNHSLTEFCEHRLLHNLGKHFKALSPFLLSILPDREWALNDESLVYAAFDLLSPLRKKACLFPYLVIILNRKSW